MKKTLIIMSLLFTSLVLAADAERGKAKSALCVACHGTDGNSVNPAWPKIAGQHEQYLNRQLSLFKSGERSGTVMAGMVAGLNEQDMKDIGAYYTLQKPNIGSADENLLERGKALYQGGNSKMKVPACMACHGISGQGNPLSGYPVVASQHAAYSELRLKAFRSGEVIADDSDSNGKIMADVAKYLSDDDIKAVASYMQGLYSD